MAYTIEISYTSNKNKAAKFKIKDNEGKVVLKSDVAIPEHIHEREADAMNKLTLHNFIPEYSTSNHFADLTTITHFHQLFGKDYLTDNIGTLSIIKKDEINTQKIQGIKNAVTLSENHYGVLKNIVLENNVFVEFKKKWYIFGQKNCIRNSDAELTSYISLGETIAAEERNIKQAIIEQENKKNNSGLKGFIKAALNFGASLVSNNSTASTNKKSNNSSYNNSLTTSSQKKSCDDTPGIFASFLQVADVFETSSTSRHSHSDSVSHSSSSSSSDYSSPSFD